MIHQAPLGEPVGSLRVGYAGRCAMRLQWRQRPLLCGPLMVALLLIVILPGVRGHVNVKLYRNRNLSISGYSKKSLATAAMAQSYLYMIHAVRKSDSLMLKKCSMWSGKA